MGRAHHRADDDARVVVITGASSGLGRATALALARRGDRLLLAARGDEALEAAARECRELGATAVAHAADTGDDAAVDALAEDALARFGRIDVWVDTAAVLIAGDLVDHTPAEIRALVDGNITGTALVARRALATFRAQGHGTLVLTASLLGILPSPIVPAYTMSKFAVRGLALSLRQAVASEPRIHVSVVMPGPMDTPMFARAGNHTGHELRAIPPAVSPERAADVVVACTLRPRRQTTTGALSHLLLAAHRLLPRQVEWAVARWSLHTVTRGQEQADRDGAVHVPLDEEGAASGDYRLGSARRWVGDRVGEALAKL